MMPVGLTAHQFNTLLEWAKDAVIDGRALAKDPLVRRKVARLAIEIEVSRMLDLRVMDAVDRGAGAEEAAMCKLYSTELELRIANTAVDMMGPYGQLAKGSKYTQADGFFEHRYRQSACRTIGGGTSELQRNIIATRYLGLPP